MTNQCGDIHEHGACLAAARARPGPPPDPHRLAVVLATQFEHDAACVSAASDRVERLTRRRWASGVSGTRDFPNIPAISSGLMPRILIAARLAWINRESRPSCT